MMKAVGCDDEFLDLFLYLVCQAWKDSSALKDWSDDLSSCDNWREENSSVKWLGRCLHKSAARAVAGAIARTA